MPMTLNGETYYLASEACKMVGISRSTLFRWLKQKDLDLHEYRDRRKWRLFTENEINKLNHEANRVMSEKQ
ncbi:MAG: hypothetical protein A2W25_05460 [candidate division Zixibacteria bacterium RBG_16_53_22]|nr:MAG: hypothetical protein A2W25_05460 [candidate division Zixibacteria bacterium RBG_16_53_22]